MLVHTYTTAAAALPAHASHVATTILISSKSSTRIIAVMRYLQAGAYLFQKALREQPCSLAAVQRFTIVNRRLAAASSSAGSGTAATAERYTEHNLMLLLLV
jgi:hypothetical protein